MIEIEKNFNLRPGDKEKIIQGAKLLSRKTFTDVYYDSDDYRLTTKDYWLRTRNGRWELKVPISRNSGDERVTDQYHELEEEVSIAEALKLSGTAPLAVLLEENGYKPFAKIVTARESYQKGGFHLDFDEMDFGFTTFEVELMITDEKEINSAESRITAFAKEYDIESTAGHGKVIECVMRNNPKHYQALAAAGVVKEV